MGRTILNDRFLLGVIYASIAVAILVAAMFVIPAKTSSLRPIRELADSKPKVILGGQEVAVDIADTPALQEQGLSFREALGTNEGMLFVFAEQRPYGFWMKDMRFPIDIIYFDQNRHLVDVWERADPSSYPKIFTPRAPAQFVLEVPAGFFSKHNLKIGNMLELVR